MHLHIAGICGTFMAGVAALARELGHEVTGSDANIYPPMSDFLRDSGIPISEDWDPTVLEPRPDIVVVGNALSRGNPLVEAVLDARIPYTSGAQWVAEHVLPGRDVIAVAGTHGKTTTTSLIAWLLEAQGLAPGYLVGGIPANFPAPARLGRGRCFVIEADEYDTAFFDKRSKFVHYRPTVAVLNNLEFDHADIFPNLEAIKRQFHHLLRTVPGNGTVVWNKDAAALHDVLSRGCWSRQVGFGSKDSEWTLGRSGSSYALRAPDGTWHLLDRAQPGRHNALNTAAALVAVAAVGGDTTAAVQHLAGFRGVKRRLELLGTVDDISVFDDFAHHPTAIAATLEALAERAPRAPRIAVLELRSNSLRSGAHRDGLAASLEAADRILVYAPPDAGWDIDAALAALGARCSVYDSVVTLLAALVEESRSGDQVLIMSNGNFNGLQDRLLEALVDRHGR